MGALASVVGLVVLAGALTSACGGAGDGGGAPATPAAAAVGISSVAGVGTVLVDGHGKALYFNSQDHGADVACTGMCAQLWLPAFVSSAAVPAGSAPGVTVLRRSDDRRWQLAYCGQPLYEFGEDAMAGQVTGNGTEDQFGGTTLTWRVATAAAGC